MYAYDMIGCVCVCALSNCVWVAQHVHERQKRSARQTVVSSTTQDPPNRYVLSSTTAQACPCLQWSGGLTGADNAISPNSQQDREAYLGDGELPFNVGFFHGLNSTGLAIAEAMAPQRLRLQITLRILQYPVQIRLQSGYVSIRRNNKQLNYGDQKATRDTWQTPLLVQEYPGRRESR